MSVSLPVTCPRRPEMAVALRNGRLVGGRVFVWLQRRQVALGLALLLSAGCLPPLRGEESEKKKKDAAEEIDRSDPEAVRRAALAQQEKLLKERDKNKNSKKDPSVQKFTRIKNKQGSSGEEQKGDPPAKGGSISLLQDGVSPDKSSDRMKITTEIGMPKQGSVLERLRSVMAAKCLDEENGGLPYEPSRATLVELDIERPLLPVGQKETRAGSVDLLKPPEKPAAAPVENLEELQEEAERRFVAGLDSRDTVIRDWSFRYGTTYRRAEAVPAMLRELKSKGWLATLAATGLGEIGKNDRDIIAALEDGLSSKEPGVRQACVHSLGQLRAESAVRPISKLIRGERNYMVRSACCGALGRIGGGDAMGVLRQIGKTPDEPELVKAEAALALARNGDRAGMPYLEACFGSSAPQLQLLALTAFIEIRDNSLPSRLISALGARYDEVWLLAVRTLPSLGPGMVQVALRETLGANVPQIRHRAALALGLMGDRQALPYIQQALLEGGLAERQMAAELLGMMGHRESAPLLMERLLEPSSAVRAAAAVALVRLDAKEALPTLVEAARGPKSSMSIALSRGGPLDVQELMLLLGCIRALKGEEGTREFTSLPAPKSTRWPEFEKELEKYQFDVLRGYQLVEVMGSSARTVAVVLRDPQGQEQTYRVNEVVASGYRVHDMHMGAYGPNAGTDAAWVVLQRGISRVTLLGDGRVEISEVKGKPKPK
jgi:HEAT repeat protein